MEAVDEHFLHSCSVGCRVVASATSFGWLLASCGMVGESTEFPQEGALKDAFVFRILSLDGGGIRGVFEAAFLAAVQDTIESPLASYFDLIAGTSTGGIIALGLGLGVTTVSHC